MPRASKSTATSRTAGARSPTAAVDAVFNAYPQTTRTRLKALRRLILDTAKTTKGVGRIEQALKWGQPSFLTPETKSLPIDTVIIGIVDSVHVDHDRVYHRED